MAVWGWCASMDSVIENSQRCCRCPQFRPLRAASSQECVLIDVSFRAVVQGDFGFVLSSTESRRFEAAMSKRLMCLNSAFLCWKLFLGEEGWILRCGKKRGIWWTLRGECMRLMRNREVTYISIVKSN